jgi:hypothetical protein
MSLKNVVKIANYYNVKYGFEKMAQVGTSSQKADLEDAIKGTGAFPVKPGSSDYDQNHPMHKQIVKILDDNEYPGQIAVMVNVDTSKAPVFSVGADSSKVKSQVEALLKATLPKVSSSLKPLAPPAEDIAIELFRV